MLIAQLILIDTISHFIKEKKGYDITIINVSKLSSLSDYFILCTEISRSLN